MSDTLNRQQLPTIILRVQNLKKNHGNQDKLMMNWHAFKPEHL